MLCSSKAFFILILCPLAVDYALAHLDRECTLLSRCNWNIKHAHCDKNNICRCQENYIKIHDHACGKPQKFGGQCDNNIVCKHFDGNMTCIEARCACKHGFYFDQSLQKCSFSHRKGKGAPLFPLTAVIFIACIGIFCGCGIICHNFRSQPELSRNIENHRRRVLNSTNNSRLRPGTSDGSSAAERTESRASSKYDSLMFDEPPPNYEDAIKDYPTEVMVVQTTAIPQQPFLHREPAKPVKL